MWGWAIIIFIAAIVFQIRSLWRSAPETRDDNRPSLFDKSLALWRSIAYRRVPGRLARYFSWPSLGVLILLVICTAALIAMSFAQHPYYRGKRAYGSPPLGVRTGLMAFALIPLVIALGGKVNIVTALTGLGHEKLNVFHRYVGWMCLLLSVIHTIPFIIQPLRAGGPAALAAQYYKPGGLEYTGTPALGMVVGLSVLSVPPIRRAAYQLFIHTHILLAIVFLGLCFWHASDLGDSWAYLWATMVIWASSLVVRVLAKTSMFSTRSRHWLSQCEVSSAPLTDGMVRLDVVAPGRWSWEAGQHFFLRFGAVRPLDNHPFTVADVPRYTASNDTEMVFYIRPQGGLTARIGKIVDAKRMGDLRVTLDGPYGTVIRPKIAMRYESVILVAGGGGISAILPWLQELVHDKTETTVLQTIKVIWVIRRANAISWVASELQRLLENAAPRSLEYDIWVTNDSAGEAAETPLQSQDEKKTIGQVLSSAQSTGSGGPSIQPAHVGSRPRMQTLIPALVSADRTLVIGCGPESLKVDLSNAVAVAQSRVSAGRAREIRLHTETFGW